MGGLTVDSHDNVWVYHRPRSLAATDAGALAEAGKIRVPTLLLVAGADEVVDPNGTLRFFAGITANLATLHQYPSLFHEVFNELPPDRKVVFADFEQWLRRQLGLLVLSAGC